VASEDGKFCNEQGCFSAARTGLYVKGTGMSDDAQPGIVAVQARKSGGRKTEDAADPFDVLITYFGQM
jgi:hypothetical protein